MKRISMVALVLATWLPASARAESVSKADCKLLSSDPMSMTISGSGVAEATKYLRAMMEAGIERVSSDSKLNKTEFMGACEKGAFRK